MFLLFEEAGKFMAGRVLSEAEASVQVELDSGKRVKVKGANVLLKFDKPAPAQLMADATTISQSIELDLAWEFAPDTEFGFAEVARDYFNADATTAQQVGALIRLYEAPHYFRRAGKGRFKKASAETVQLALAGIEKKKQIQAQIETWSNELMAGHCPAPIKEQLYKILFRPDKNSPEYKAVVEASRASQTAPLTLLQNAGAIASAYDFHWQRFLFDHFPKGTGFPKLEAPAIVQELPLATVQAYSIDDSQTTEIDDALSLQGLGSGQVVVGIHIAAPGLAIVPNSAIDNVGRHRLSTVYMPGYKITMLPDEVVQSYTLAEGQACPAVSLYVTLDEATLSIQHTETHLERVPIKANLRHDQLDQWVTPAWLEDASPAAREGEPQLPIAHSELAFFWRLAQHLKAGREVVRGKPENFNRPDYNFRLVRDDKDTPPTGQELVQISVRQRGAPLDLIVAEAMILANSTWGQWLASLGVPAIYRSQASMAPGVKVRMGTKALPHAAALAAPFKPKDAQLFAIISAFDAAYTAYNGYQSGMERFWTLQYLKQENITEVVASLVKEMAGGSWLVRADHLPLMLTVMGASGLMRGDKVRVQLGAIDVMALDVSGTVIEKIITEHSEAEDSEANLDEAMEDLDAAATGPIAIALNVNEAPAEE
ncbi:MAG: RNB domain-containing ribonuclease [Betaproteobacteria bacterium]|nr:RNB domain-containing ribonuclease [Betaproteobacteria bacterium]